MLKKPTISPGKNNQKDIERVGRLLGFVYESNFVSRSRMLRLSFLRGFLSGIGGFFGATLGAGILLWVASLLLDVPLVGSLIEMFRDVSR
ncbi:MAG: DUF5665 domain-containing protein [Candidatus Saccharibacteria bacterium]|nr:DUF5665 domain-containing protein [Candidatus Saccharibacteria bacterium]